MFVFKVAVIGVGTMGGELACAIAAAGFPVVVKDVDEQRVEHGLERVRAIWQDKVEAGRLTSGAFERQLALIAGTTTYDGFGDVDFAVEAVPEQMEVKQRVLAELDVVTPGQAVLASTTSALSIGELAQATSRPDKVVGFHCFHPASVMRLVEVVEGFETSPETMQTAISFAQAIRKVPMRCDDVSGFVVNRILGAALEEVVRFQRETGTPVEQLERAMTDAKATPIGPFALADQLGLDLGLR